METTGAARGREAAAQMAAAAVAWLDTLDPAQRAASGLGTPPVAAPD